MPTVSVPKDDGEVVAVLRADGSEFTRTVKNGRIQVDEADLQPVLATVQGASLVSKPDTSSKDK